MAFRKFNTEPQNPCPHARTARRCIVCGSKDTIDPIKRAQRTGCLCQDFQVVCEDCDDVISS